MYRNLNQALFPSACSGKYRKSQLLFLLDAVLINAAVILTNGVFLSGYIVSLNGPDFLVGLLNNASSWASIAALFSFLIFERMERRKPLLIALNISSRFLICTAVCIPLIVRQNIQALAWISGMVILGNVLWSIYGIAWMVWIASTASDENRSHYFNIRMLCLRISFTIISVVMGFVLDAFQKSYWGFFIVFMVSLLLSVLDIAVLVRIDEPPNATRCTRMSAEMFFEPFASRTYRKFLLFVFFFYTALTMATSFTPLYMIRYLGLDYGFISTVNVLMYIVMITCTLIWGRVEKKRGLLFVLRTASLFIIGEVLLDIFVRKETVFLFFFAIILSGIGNGGFNIAILSYRYEIMPQTNKTVYEGWFGAVFGISTFIGPVLGNRVMQVLPTFRNTVFQYSRFQLLYMIAFTLTLGVILFMFYLPSHKKDITLHQSV